MANVTYGVLRPYSEQAGPAVSAQHAAADDQHRLVARNAQLLEISEQALDGRQILVNLHQALDEHVERDVVSSPASSIRSTSI
ncbi:MAG: hypothetical protein PF501_15955 [Salinisphaera sp.]|nr:hypothetical protein [Salinisphaera sp.]